MGLSTLHIVMALGVLGCMASASATCKDNHKDCKWRARDGYCDINTWVYATCKLSCKFCTTSESIPAKPTLTSKPLSGTFNEGDSVMLICDSSNSPAIPGMTYNFFKEDGWPADCDLSGNVCVFDPYDHRTDDGNYTCRAIGNGHESEHSDAFHLKPSTPPVKRSLTSQPATTHINQKNITLVCARGIYRDYETEVTKELYLNYTWTKNGEKLETDEIDNTLVIDQLTEAISGSYACQATNHAGASEFSNAVDLPTRPDSPDQAKSLCERWVNREHNTPFSVSKEETQWREALYDCPCNVAQMGAQWVRKIGGDAHEGLAVCFEITRRVFWRIERLRSNPLQKVCCYARHEDPILMTFLSGRTHYKRDDHLQVLPSFQHIWPYLWCCRDTRLDARADYCAAYRFVRPLEECNPNPTMVPASAIGDPHLVTFDGNTYSMNGLGEYVLVKSGDFELQARTARARKADGSQVQATVFVAFAVRDGGSRFQVELKPDLTTMAITVSGTEDISNDFYQNGEYRREFNDWEISRPTKSNANIAVTAVFPSFVSITVEVGLSGYLGHLDISTTIPMEMKGRLSGLMGNFDDDPDNDFITPDGTVLAASLTEREILETFAEPWRVGLTDSAFKYSLGQNTESFQDRSFQPVFMSEVYDAEQLEAADALCGDSVACRFDLIATGEEEFAKHSLAKELEMEENRMMLTSVAPSINFTTDATIDSNGYVEVNAGEQVVITFFVASDATSTGRYTFMLRTDTTVLPHNYLTFDPSTGVIDIIADINTPVAVGVQARSDTSGLYSVELQLTVVVQYLHDGCLPEVKEYLGGRFITVMCVGETWTMSPETGTTNPERGTTIGSEITSVAKIATTCAVQTMGGMSGAAVAGVVIAVVALIAIAIVLIVFLRGKSQTSSRNTGGSSGFDNAAYTNGDSSVKIACKNKSDAC